MIEQSIETVKEKKASKGKKKNQPKLIEEQFHKLQKIKDEASQIPESNQPNPKPDQIKMIEAFYESLEDLVSYVILDHQEFKSQIQAALISIQQYDLSHITHKHIMAYSFLGKLSFIYKKLQASPINFNQTIIENLKQRMLQIFKQGIRSYDHLRKLYKDF